MDQITNFIGGLTGTINFDIILDNPPTSKTFKMKNSQGHKVQVPVYTGKDDISGIITAPLKDTKKLEHLGIKCSLVGYLEIYSDSDLSTQFHILSKQLQPAGLLTQNKTFKFKFPCFEKQYQTFNGIAGRVRYFIRVACNRNYKISIIKEVDFAVLLPDDSIEKQQKILPMKMEVGIDDCLHIDFQYNKSFFHLKDIILGRVNFYQVKIKLKSCHIALIRKQTFGTGTTTKTQTDTLVSYQVMDGCPESGEHIPIRMYMSGVKLSPSYQNIHNRLQVRYWINLILIDENEKRYFKQTEITVYRKP